MTNRPSTTSCYIGMIPILSGVGKPGRKLSLKWREMVPDRIRLDKASVAGNACVRGVRGVSKQGQKLSTCCQEKA